MSTHANTKQSSQTSTDQANGPAIVGGLAGISALLTMLSALLIGSVGDASTDRIPLVLFLVSVVLAVVGLVLANEGLNTARALGVGRGWALTGWLTAGAVLAFPIVMVLSAILAG